MAFADAAIEGEIVPEIATAGLVLAASAVWGESRLRRVVVDCHKPQLNSKGVNWAARRPGPTRWSSYREMRLKVAKTPYESGPTRGTSPRYGSVSAGGPCRRTGAAVLDVPIQNLNPDVMMMEPAEDRYRSDAADLGRAEDENTRVQIVHSV